VENFTGNSFSASSDELREIIYSSPHDDDGKIGWMEAAVHKSYKHCRYDLINISHNVTRHVPEKISFRLAMWMKMFRFHQTQNEKFFIALKSLFRLSLHANTKKERKGYESFDYFSPSKDELQKLQRTSANGIIM
jgi:hypothetical protein